MSTDDPIAVLERELIDAAHRQASGRLDRRRGTTGWIAIAVVVAVTVAVGASALLLLGGHQRPASRPTIKGRQQLINMHPPLRRPQTQDDLPGFLSQLTQGPPSVQQIPDLPLVRFATVAPWGEKLFLVPVKPPRASALARQRPRLPRSVMRELAASGERLDVFSRRGGGGAGDPAMINADLTQIGSATPTVRSTACGDPGLAAVETSRGVRSGCPSRSLRVALSRWSQGLKRVRVIAAWLSWAEPLPSFVSIGSGDDRVGYGGEPLVADQPPVDTDPS